MTQSIYQVDAFTNRPFAGNPAAVCVLDAPADVAWMRAVAGEMNLSETAFLHPESHPHPERSSLGRLPGHHPQRVNPKEAVFRS